MATSAGTGTIPAGLSADEYALYDRQVRLWGPQAQQSIGAAHVLVISLRALGTEVAKNLTLAGVGSLTIIDDDLVTEEDLGACYFLREEDVGKPRAESAIPRLQELNSRVRIQSGGSLVSLLTPDPTFFAPYSLIVTCDLDFSSLSLINTAARLALVPSYASGIHGEFGFIFADLVDHQYVVERDVSNKAAVIGPESTTRSIVDVHTRRETGGSAKEVITKREVFCPLLLANSSPLDAAITSKARRLRSVPALLPALRALFDFQRNNGRLPNATLNLDLAFFTKAATDHAKQLLLPAETLTADFLRTFIQALGSEVPTTASFVGSRLSEDVINAITHREQPIQNFALFDGDSGPIYCLYTQSPEVLMSVPPVMTNGVFAVAQQAENGIHGFANGTQGELAAATDGML